MYIHYTKYEWCEIKARANLKWHGIAFDKVHEFDWSQATVNVDDRKDYGEMRFIALGPINARIHVLIFTLRKNTIRVISLRKANAREIRRYEEEIEEAEET